MSDDKFNRQYHFFVGRLKNNNLYNYLEKSEEEIGKKQTNVRRRRSPSIKHDIQMYDFVENKKSVVAPFLCLKLQNEFDIHTLSQLVKFLKEKESSLENVDYKIFSFLKDYIINEMKK